MKRNAWILAALVMVWGAAAGRAGEKHHCCRSVFLKKCAVMPLDCPPYGHYETCWRILPLHYRCPYAVDYGLPNQPGLVPPMPPFPTAPAAPAPVPQDAATYYPITPVAPSAVYNAPNGFGWMPVSASPPPTQMMAGAGAGAPVMWVPSNYAPPAR